MQKIKDQEEVMPETVENQPTEETKETSEKTTEEKAQASEQEPENLSESSSEAGEKDKASDAEKDAPKQIAVSISSEEYKKLTKAAEERDEYLDRLQRTAAELSNYQKRMERQLENMRRHGIERLIEDLLPVLDSFDRALQASSQTPEIQSFLEGFRMVHDQFLRALAKHGVKEIKAEIGQPFDPRYHEAMMHEFTDEAAPNSITEVFDKGYEINGRVLRATKVKVAMAPPKPHKAESAEKADQAEEAPKDESKESEAKNAEAESKEKGEGDES